MKKALALVMAAAMTLGLVACGGQPASSESASTAPSEPASVAVSAASSEAA
ncbi:secreted protein, partial [gut metagenome]